MAPMSAKDLRGHLAQVIERHGGKATEAAKRAEAKLPDLEARDKSRAERAKSREDSLKQKYPSIRKGR